MGKALSYYKAALRILDEAKKVVTLIPSNYQDNFNNKYNDINTFLQKADKANRSIYFESEIPFEKLPALDLQNFVKLEPALDNIQAKLPIEDKLRHIVPPEVRVM